MDLLQAIVLALLQGFTEFLPISSSAHLILVPVVAQWPDQGLAFDVAVHVGTLSAVVAYYRHELRVMARAFIQSLITRKTSEAARLVWQIGWGTVPVGLVGIALPAAVENALRSPVIIASSTLLFALLLGFAEIGAREQREHITWRDVLVIGVMQALALIPGTSRSGITMTAGLLRGLTRGAAARFSFLLSIPVIALAGALKAIELIQAPTPVPWVELVVGISLSAITAYLTIGAFLRLLQRFGMMPFVYYRIVLAAVLFWVFGFDF